MSALFQRVFGWLANELITKKLANSATFQRMAHKTHETISSATEKVGVLRAEPPPRPRNPYRISEYTHNPTATAVKKNTAQPSQKPADSTNNSSGASPLTTFVSAFRENLKREAVEFAKSQEQKMMNKRR